MSITSTTNSTKPSIPGIGQTEKKHGAHDAEGQATSITVAPFAGMYKSAVAAAVDSNDDARITQEEYSRQIIAAGGTQAQAIAQFGALDKDHLGSVSVDAFAQTVVDPLGSDGARKIQSILDQIHAGQSTTKVSGNILDATGQVKDPDQVLRYLAGALPGNLGK